MKKARVNGFALLGLVYLGGCTAEQRLYWAEKIGGEALRAKALSSPAPVGSGASLPLRPVQESSEYLAEMYRVVYFREPRAGSEFASLVNGIQQGASLEGIYHGLIYNAAYRNLETSVGAAKTAALQVFAQEWMKLDAVRASPTELQSDQAEPLAEPQLPEPVTGAPVDVKPLGQVASQDRGEEGVEKEVEEEGTGVGEEISFSGETAHQKPAQTNSKKAEKLKTARMTIAQVKKHFSKSSAYILKRTLAAEAMKLIQEASVDRGALNEWYAQWTAGMADQGVDFGLASRNRKDVEFHLVWAKAQSLDSMRWEVVSRLHRVVNQAEWGAPVPAAEKK